MQNPPAVDQEKVTTPQVNVTPEAWMQLKLIKKMDFTLVNKHVRVAIKGKECDGFTYEVYFDTPNEDDFIINVEEGTSPSVILDPFSAFYLPSFTIKYMLNLENSSEGFFIENHKQSQHHGKFWVKKGGKTPPLI